MKTLLIFIALASTAMIVTIVKNETNDKVNKISAIIGFIFTTILAIVLLYLEVQYQILMD